MSHLKSLEIFITRTDGVVVFTMSRADAERLFHAVNRTMACLDDAQAQLSDGDLIEDGDPGDTAAYDTANEFLALMLQQLHIDPDADPSLEGRAHSPEREDGG